MFLMNNTMLLRVWQPSETLTLDNINKTPKKKGVKLIIPVPAPHGA